MLERVGSPLLGGLLLSKAAVAAERGIDMRLGPQTRLDDNVGDVKDLITVVGNLVDNAFDAVQTVVGGERWVEVSVHGEGDGVVVRVHDSGPGIKPGEESLIFNEGFTTKANGTTRRGLGLALVKQIVERRGGEIRVSSDGGAIFEARLPVTMGAVRA
jgi:two-component system CitB family sensor kinase